jgi:phosphate transport system substrate-binding protein
MNTTFCNARVAVQNTCLLKAAGLIALAVFLAGCPAAKKAKVVIRGSNTFGEELAPRLIAEYGKEHPAVTFDLEFKGTLYGLGALLNSRCDLAAASREASLNELGLARDRGVEFNDHVIGAYAVAVIVNAGNPLQNLTQDQVRDLFTGAARNWKDVGGKDAPVHLYIRDPISGTYLGFRELAMENKPYALGPKAFTNYTGIVRAVAQDANGIGYAGIDPVKKDGVKSLSIAGVAPTVFSVNKGQYPYARILRLYTAKANEASEALDFIQFVQSATGQNVLDQMGFVPRP